MRLIASAVALALCCTAAYASDMATPDEAKAMSENAQAAVNEMGRDKAFAAFSADDGGFKEKDLYVFCMDMDGVALFACGQARAGGQEPARLQQVR